MKLQNGSLLSKIKHGVSFLYFAQHFIPPFCTPKCWLQFPQMPSWIAKYGAVYMNRHHHPMMCVISFLAGEKGRARSSRAAPRGLAFSPRSILCLSCRVWPSDAVQRQYGAQTGIEEARVLHDGYRPDCDVQPGPAFSNSTDSAILLRVLCKGFR